jgi:hypothetical protein
MSLVQLENRVGKPIKVGPYKIVPIEQSFQVQPPGMWAFLFWRKPSSVVVQHPDGTDEVLDLPDVTRQAQISILGLTLFITLIFGLFTFLRANNSIKE